MNWSDAVIGVGSLVFLLALLPGLWRPPVPNPWTSGVTGTVLLGFAASYAWAGWWFAAGTAFATSCVWYLLLVRYFQWWTDEQR